MSPLNYPDFSAYLEAKKSDTVTSTATRTLFPVVEQTDQSRARDALAKSQEKASKQATIETKMKHYINNGRYHIASEILAMSQVTVRPADLERVAYIQELRKSLKHIDRSHAEKDT